MVAHGEYITKFQISGQCPTFPLHGLCQSCPTEPLRFHLKPHNWWMVMIHDIFSVGTSSVMCFKIVHSFGLHRMAYAYCKYIHTTGMGQSFGSYIRTEPIYKQKKFKIFSFSNFNDSCATIFTVFLFSKYLPFIFSFLLSHRLSIPLSFCSSKIFFLYFFIFLSSKTYSFPSIFFLPKL